MAFGFHTSNSNIIFIRQQQVNGTINFHINTISFINQNNSQSLSLLRNSSGKKAFNIFDFIPRQFTITTRDSTSQFNIEMLKESSSVIAQQLQNDPDNLTYHLDISDKENVLSKFELLYQGKCVTFDEDELPISHKITKNLNITSCPNFMKPESLKTFSESMQFNSNSNVLSVQIDLQRFDKFISNSQFETFVIKTNKSSYNCNKFGIHSSAVIRNFLSENHSKSEFKYDFDDEFDEFQSICDLFNFNNIVLTRNNMDSLKFIVDDLQIDCISEDIEKYIDVSEKVSKTIDDQQTIVTQIDELFDMLYNIKEKTVETVKKMICESNWSKTAEKVQELCAFFLQVIESDFMLHQHIFDLLIQLDIEASETNKLEVLIPFFSKHLILMIFGHRQSTPIRGQPVTVGYNFPLKVTNDMLLNGNNNFKMTLCSFLYKLYKNKIIPKEEIFSNLTNHYVSKNLKDINLLRSSGYFNNLTIWFLPEIIEISPFFSARTTLPNYSMSESDTEPQIISSFIQTFLPDKIDLYKQMRDMDEPGDKLTIALRIDDVDTVQSILSKSGSNVTKSFVPFNLFEGFVENGRTSYINYAAAYGSVKCFKYLLLNYDKIDKSTFKYAVYGGNIEIIKIVDQQASPESTPDNNKLGRGLINNLNFGGFGAGFNYPFDNSSSIDLEIIPSIIKHSNDLFDWILDQKYTDDNIKQQSLFSLLKCSIKNGNAHSFIGIIDKGYVLNEQQRNELIQIASQKGFYLLTQLLLKFCANKFNDKSFGLDFLCSTSFGNLSIFKLFIKMMNQIDLQNCLSLAVSRRFMNIIHYFFDELAYNEFELTQTSISKALQQSINQKTNDLFNYILDKVKEKNKDIFHNFENLNALLDDASNYHNIEAAETITNLIYEDDPDHDFTQHFINAAQKDNIELCKYFVDKKLSINYEKLSSNVSELGSINEELFSLIGSVSPEAKNRIFRCIKEAITKNNKSLVEYLLKNNAPCDDALFTAVVISDVDIVNIILKYTNKPSFINKKSMNGTALQIAVKKNNFEIVKTLLSIPGIDPSIYCLNNETPLCQAICNLNLEITNLLIDFYGDDIINQKWQIINAVEKIISYSPEFSSIDQQSVEKKSNIIKRLLEIQSIDINHHFTSNTLLTFACQFSDIGLVEYLLKNERIDVNLYEPKGGYTPLMIAVKNNNINIVKVLLEHPRININLMNYEEQTALTIAVIFHFDNIIDLLIKNDKFDHDESRLDYAFFISSGETSKKLLSVDSLDVNYNSVRNLEKKSEDEFTSKIKKIALKKNSLKIKKYGTALTNAVDEGNLDLINLIVKHPTFDKSKSLIKVAIAKSVYNNKVEIMNKLLSLVDNDLNICDIDGNCLLDYAIMNLSEDVISEILNKDNFKSMKVDFVNLFVKCYTNINNNSNLIIDENSFSLVDKTLLLEEVNGDIELEEGNDDNANHNNFPDANEKSPVDVMNLLYDYDNEHDHLIDFHKLLPNGKSFFSVINRSSRYDIEIVDFLLQHGVDPNQPDKFNYYPLENAIVIHSKDFVTSLLHTNQIDFSVKIPFKKYQNDNLTNKFNPIKSTNSILLNIEGLEYVSYLHLAAATSSVILNEFLNVNDIDVNVTNNLGETPLMMAVRHRKRDCITSLFQRNDLDYLHKNKKGQNAIDICGHRTFGYMNQQVNNDGQDEEKTKFLNRLFVSF
ncbi:hypothetical protein M9Y10_000515 [Tritrichomonas musculus]|uniref:DUF3447 domain-containing protein n=1 Tax=Tritrichomonas musculus TaxID=1915356 RepID=A0ABR2L4F7_9EUKA